MTTESAGNPLSVDVFYRIPGYPWPLRFSLTQEKERRKAVIMIHLQFRHYLLCQ